MDSSTIVGAIIIGAGSLISILTPLFKINSNITQMRSSINNMLENDKIRDERLRLHGSELDSIATKIAEHEIRIKQLENNN